MDKVEKEKLLKNRPELSAVDMTDKSSYADTVIKIANQYSIDPAIVASILLDYKTWKTAESAAESAAVSE